MKPQTVARQYGISEKTAYDLAKSSGIRRRKWQRWTEEEKDAIRTWYPSKGGAWDGWERVLPGRDLTVDDIQQAAHRLGVHRNV